MILFLPELKPWSLAWQTGALTMTKDTCVDLEMISKNNNKLEQCFQMKTYVPPPVWTDILLK